MGSKQYHRWRVTFSVSEEAYEKLNEVDGNRSAWVEQLILGSPVPEDGKVETFRLNDLERRMVILETVLVDGNGGLRTGSMDREDPLPSTAAVMGTMGPSELPEGGRGEAGRQRAADPRFQREVIRRYEAGEVITKIMKELRTGHRTVMRILEEEGLS